MDSTGQATSLRINRRKAGLLVIDVQERLLPEMFGKENLIQNCVRLIQGATVLGLPIFSTEQYRKGLGTTVPEIATALGSAPAWEKLDFSACAADGLLPSLQGRGVSDVVLCGIEAHVCVCQTCLDLLASGHRAFVVAGAIASRTEQNQELAIERMRAAGAAIVSTEMILFELLERAGTDEFRRILELVK